MIIFDFLNNTIFVAMKMFSLNFVTLNTVCNVAISLYQVNSLRFVYQKMKGDEMGAKKYSVEGDYPTMRKNKTSDQMTF